MKEYYLKGEIYYRVNEFQSGKPTLVFVHGVSGSSSAWWPYEEAFKDKYNVLSYDIRGHGMSKKFRDPVDYEIKKFAYDLHELVTSLHIQKFILISNSFGSLIALEYLKSWRSMVIANILTSPELYTNRDFSKKIIYFLLNILTGIIGFLPFDPKPRGHVDYDKHRGSTDWDIKRNWADMRNTGIHAHFYTLEHSFAPHQEYFLEKINLPTLIIHGGKDTMVSMKNAMAISKKIKGSELIVIPKIDHNTVHNAVMDMQIAIENFINKNLIQ